MEDLLFVYGVVTCSRCHRESRPQNLGCDCLIGLLSLGQRDQKLLQYQMVLYDYDGVICCTDRVPGMRTGDEDDSKFAGCSNLISNSKWSYMHMAPKLGCMRHFQYFISFSSHWNPTFFGVMWRARARKEVGLLRPERRGPEVLRRQVITWCWSRSRVATSPRILELESIESESYMSRLSSRVRVLLGRTRSSPCPAGY